MSGLLVGRGLLAGEAAAADPSIVWRHRAGFALVFVVVNLHLLRNVSAVGYLAVYVVVGAWILCRFIRIVDTSILADHGLIILVWIGIGLLGLMTSLAIISPFGAAYGTVRYLFSLPVFFALVVFTRTMADLRSHITTMVIFFVLASWTLPAQFVTGPIPWFDEASVRGAEVRYSSLVGSLTSIGVIAGCYAALCAVFKHPWVWVGLVMVSLPATLSLSKAALANVVLGCLLCLWFNRRRVAVLASAVVGIPVVAALSYAFVPAVRSRVETVAVSFGVQSDAGVLSNDVSFSQSILDRLTELPALNWNALGDLNNPLVYILGGGYGMGNTALVTESDVTAPMAHNQFVETLTVFGLVGGLAQVAILLIILVLLVGAWLRTRHLVFGVVAGTYGLFLLNALLANGVIYQPASASIFFLAMFVSLSPQLRRDAIDDRANLRCHPRKVNYVDFAELMRATRRHWIYGLVAGVVGVIGTIAAGGALASDPGSTAPVTSHVRLAFVPKTDSVETAADTATYIETQMAYWFQLSQTDETLTEANGGDGSPSALARTRADCVVEQPALNLMELKCTSTESDDDDTRAFLVVWSEAVSASVMDRGIADGLRESILISNVTAPITSDTPPAGSADASALIYPFALLVGLIAAMTAIMVRHRGTRRPRIGRPFASSESEAE